VVRMRNGWPFAVAVLISGSFILSAAGCAHTANRARLAKNARDDLLGLSRPGLISCAGDPVKEERIGDREFLTYVSDQSLGPEACVATFVIRRDLVDQLDYSSPSGMLPKQPAACGYIVAKCMPEDSARKAGI